MSRDNLGRHNESLAELVEDAPCGIVVTDPDGRLRYVNETLNRWLGLSAPTNRWPTRLPDLMTTPGRLFYETHLAPMMRLQGFVREISCSLKVEGGPPLPVLLSGIARRDDAGHPVRFDYTIFDARERRIYEDELRAARLKADELAAIVLTSPNAILRADHAGRINSWNASAERLFGQTAEAALGNSVQDVVRLQGLPDWFRTTVAERKNTGESILEAVCERGQDLEITVAPIAEHGTSASMQSYSVVLRDISKRRRAERQLQVVMGEMTHRVKNTLAVVSGIARQTLSKGERQEFLARLLALSKAHDALARTDRKGTDLRDLLALTTEEAGGPGRFRVSGQTVQLSREETTSISMALHELVTNALKYGALSDPRGYVQFDCIREDHEGTGAVRLIWQERDGPPVVPPTRQGFGSRMISQVIAVDLSAKVDLDYRSEGVRCEIVFTPSKTD